MIHDKVFWFDTETTGLDPKANCMLSLGYLIEIDNEVQEEGELFMAPGEGDTISLGAMKVNRFTVEQLKSFPPQRETFQAIKNILSRRVDKYNKQDKLTAAGFNVGFDLEFARALFLKFGDRYFGSWFFGTPLDVRTYVAEAIRRGLRLADYKLTTLCAHFNIPLGEAAHGALADVRATRCLYVILKEALATGAL